MQVTLRLRLLAGCAAIALLQTAALVSSAQKPVARAVRKFTRSPVPPQTPLQMAESYNKIAQDRFQDITGQTFGLSRLVILPSRPFQYPKEYERPLSDLGFAVGFYHLQPSPAFREPLYKPIHGKAIDPKTGKEKEVVYNLTPPKQAHTLTVARQPSPKPFQPFTEFLEMKTRENLAAAATIAPQALERWKKENDKTISEACAKALADCKAGKEVAISIPKHKVLFRPVLAKNKACIGCHSTNKIGDALGVLFYVVPTK